MASVEQAKAVSQFLNNLNKAATCSYDPIISVFTVEFGNEFVDFDKNGKKIEAVG